MGLISFNMTANFQYVASPLFEATYAGVASTLFSQQNWPTSLHSLGQTSKASSEQIHFICDYVKDQTAGLVSTTCKQNIPDFDITMALNAHKEDAVVEDVFTGKSVKCLKIKVGDGAITYQKELSSVIEKILKSEAAKQLLSQVLAEGPCTFLTADSQTVPMGGLMVPDRRFIYISRSENANRKLGHAVFEMCNLLNAKMTMSLKEGAEAGSIAKEAYVEKWERIEYESLKKFTSTIRLTTAKDHWSKETDMDLPLLFSRASGWTGFWNLIKNSNHADQYRLDWKRNFQKLYCKKHPGAMDCR